jgi:ATP-dependent Lon protease
MDPHMFSGREKNETRSLPMMPIRDVVIFPHMMTPFVVGRETSIRALEEALAGDKKIFLATQHDAAVDEPKPNEIYQVGTIANIVQSLKLPDGNIKVLVEGVERGKILKISNEEGYFRVSVQTKQFRPVTTPSLEQLVQRATSLFEQYVKLSQSLNYETMIAAVKVDEIGKFTDTIAANLNVSIEEKQELLEIFDPVDRLTRLADILEIEIEKLNVDRTIQGRVKRQMERAQREYYLNEKIKAIQKELGRNEKSEIDELKKKIETAGMTKDALDHAMSELKRLEMMPPMSAESTVSRNYLDWLAGRSLEEEIQRNPRYQPRPEGAGRRPLRAGEDQGTHPGIPGGAAARQESARARSSASSDLREWERLPWGRSIARATGRKFVRLSSGWSAGRSGNPRPPPDLHRRPARPNHPDDEKGGHGKPDFPAG